MENTDMTLVVKEKNLGKLTTNALEIKAFVAKRLEDYTPEKYQGDAKAAAKDKAELNAVAKKLNDERIKLEKEWMQPFLSFKDVVSDTCELIKNASGKLDAIVKAREAEEKDAKRKFIEQAWAEENFTLVELDRVFNPKWLNKTAKLPAIQAEMKDIISGIKRDLAALDAYGEDTAQLKEHYLVSLDIAGTLQMGARLKASREKLAEAEQPKAELPRSDEAADTRRVIEELEDATAAVVEEVRRESQPLPQTEAGNFQPGGIPWTFNVVGSRDDVDAVLRMAEGFGVLPGVTLRGTEEQIAVLKERMSLGGISYVKQHFLTLEVRREG